MIRRSGSTLLAVSLAVASFAGPIASRGGTTAAAEPITFETNLGQAPSDVRFIARTPSGRLYVTDTGTITQLPLTSDRSQVLRTSFVGGRARSAEGLVRSARVSHYLVGERDSWIRNVPHHTKIRLNDVYPGIDVVFTGGDALEYDFEVAPGADPDAIALRYAGAHGLRVDSRGDLMIGMEGLDVRERAPVTFEGRRLVPSRFILRGDTVRFAIGAYDPTRSLRIDPVIEWSTLVGGDVFDEGRDVTVDTEGNAYITGRSSSTNYPTTDGAYQRANGGPDVWFLLWDAFVTKYSPSGAVLFSTYIGGASFDYGHGIALGPDGAIWITGMTGQLSANRNPYPVTPGSYRTTKKRYEDVNVTALTSDGSALKYSTLLPGEENERGNDIEITPEGLVYLTGETQSLDFPVTGTALQPKKAQPAVDPANQLFDNFFAVLDPSAVGDAQLVYSTYLGGTMQEAVDDYYTGNGIALDREGNAWITGRTDSPDFPVTADASQPAIRGGTDAFVVKIDPRRAGSASLRYSTFVGGTLEDMGAGIDVGPDGNVYVAGMTSSLEFPLSFNPIGMVRHGPGDAFALKLSPRGRPLNFTFFGGADWDRAWGIAARADGSVWIVGETNSTDFPTASPTQAARGGSTDAFVALLEPTFEKLTFSTYLGGEGLDEARRVAVDPDGDAIVTGVTLSQLFPTTPGAPQSGSGGNQDTFTVKYAL